MPGTTMDWKVSDPNLLDTIKAGDTPKISTDRNNESFGLTTIEVASSLASLRHSHSTCTMFIRTAMPALAAALLFGASTPLAKLLVGDVHALLLAGLLYLGSGLGLTLLIAWRWARDRTAGQRQTPLEIPRKEIPWLLGAIVFGGMLGPALLMLGLTQASGASASLLLNVEGVLTAIIAWVVFKENADRQIVVGMMAIVAGGALLSWEPGGAAFSTGALFILGACLCWAIDNNLTRKVSTNDAMLVAGLKGLVAGACNTALALAQGASLPTWPTVGASLLVGFFGYGLSLTLFVVALRVLGTARTGAYFSVAPLFGVVLSLVIWPSATTPIFWAAAASMALGIWLHVRERHLHEHSHEPLEHSHPHRHDEHHQHHHDFDWDSAEPHAHQHRHDVLTHKHPHYPDIHHRHAHSH
ncbi:DMT family transporter [soil metagenome]